MRCSHPPAAPQVNPPTSLALGSMISKLSAALTFCPTTDPEVVHTQEKATMISLQYIQYQIFMLDTLLMLHVNSISIKLEEKKSILNKKHERSPKLVLQVLYYYISCEIRDTKGTFHAKMGSIKDRNCMDLTEAEDIKKRWQEYTEELYKKDLHNPDNHDGVITHLEPEWNVKSSGP